MTRPGLSSQLPAHVAHGIGRGKDQATQDPKARDADDASCDLCVVQSQRQGALQQLPSKPQEWIMRWNATRLLK